MSAGGISLYFWSQFCYSYFPYIKLKIPTRYLNPESRNDFVANPASRKYLNPESRDNFGANSVSRNQKRPYPASRETPLGAPLRGEVSLRWTIDYRSLFCQPFFKDGILDFSHNYAAFKISQVLPLRSPV